VPAPSCRGRHAGRRSWTGRRRDRAIRRSPWCCIAVRPRDDLLAVDRHPHYSCLEVLARHDVVDDAGHRRGLGPISPARFRAVQPQWSSPLTVSISTTSCASIQAVQSRRGTPPGPSAEPMADPTSAAPPIDDLATSTRPSDEWMLALRGKRFGVSLTSGPVEPGNAVRAPRFVQARAPAPR
jgi:hypothetical protein